MTNIKAAREVANMSQKEVALTLKVSAPTVSDWEAGKIKPSADNLVNLSQLYNVSINYLLNKPLHTKQPVNMLCCMYGVSALELEKICGIDYQTAEYWLKGDHEYPDGPNRTMYPKGEMAEKISAFFETPCDMLETGCLFPDVFESVKNKIEKLRNKKSFKFGPQLFSEPEISKKNASPDVSREADPVVTKIGELVQKMSPSAKQQYLDILERLIALQNPTQ